MRTVGLAVCQRFLRGKMPGSHSRQSSFLNNWDTPYLMLLLSDFTFPKSANKTNLSRYFPSPSPDVLQICYITFCKYKLCFRISPQASCSPCHSCLWSFTLECILILRGEFLTMLPHFWSPEISCTGVLLPFSLKALWLQWFPKRLHICFFFHVH